MPRRPRVGVAAAAALCAFAAPGPVPTPIGVGPRFHPPPTSPAVAAARPVGRLTCRTRLRRPVRAHVEVFARKRVVIVPAGIGVRPPLVRRDGFVRPVGCSYPLRTVEPTGVVELDPNLQPHLGELFSVWGQRLGPKRLLSFSGAVRAYVAGRRWRGDPRRIPLRRHSQIVVQVGGYVPPHGTYLFGPGR